MSNKDVAAKYGVHIIKTMHKFSLFSKDGTIV